MQVGGETRERQRGEVHRARPLGSQHPDPIFPGFYPTPGVLKLAELHTQVIWHASAHHHFAGGDGGCDRVRSGFDPIGNHSMSCRIQRRNTQHPDRRSPGPENVGPHGVEKCRQVLELRLPGGVFDHGLAPGQDGREENVLRRADTGKVKVDLGSNEPVGHATLEDTVAQLEVNTQLP